MTNSDNATDNAKRPMPLAGAQLRLLWLRDYLWPAYTYHPAPREGLHTLWIVETGRLCVTQGGRDFVMEGGSIMLSSTGPPRTLRTEDNTRWQSLGLALRSPGGGDPLALLQLPFVWHPGDAWERCLAWSRDLSQHANGGYHPKPPEEALSPPRREGAPETEMICRGLAGALLGLTLRHAAPLVNEMPAPSWVQRAVEHLQIAPGESLAVVARHVGISPAQLRRDFHRWIGMSPRDYQKQLLAETAREWLENGDEPVATIARRLGFSDAAHFTRFWKSAQGTTPAQHRLLSREGTT